MGTSSKAGRRLTREENQQRFVLGVADKVEGIIKELVRASLNNPLMGIAVAIITVDVLYRAKIISITAAQAIYVAAGVYEGGQIIADIAEIIPSIGTKQNSAAVGENNTFAFTETSSKSSELDALLTRLGKK
ncbi:MAG: hypothetical protein ACYCO0_05290 [Candidatus Micrarchaeaceae archaeon]